MKTVNLVDLSIGFKSKAKKESSYKRLQRFLKELKGHINAIANILYKQTKPEQLNTLSNATVTVRHYLANLWWYSIHL